MRADDLPLQYNCADVLEHNLKRRADKVALYSLERDMTFREISREVNRAGNALKQMDVRIGDSVAILSHDAPEWATTFFAAIKVGGVAVGFNTTQTSDEYAYMLDDSRARVLVVHASLWPAVENIRVGRPFLEH